MSAKLLFVSAFCCAGLASAACPGITIDGTCFQLATIALPGYNSQLTAANSGGTSVGTFSTLNQFIGPEFGFLLPNGGTSQTIHEPNSLPAGAANPYTLTQAAGINDSQEVTGWYNDARGMIHGFTLTGGVSGTYTTFDYFSPTISGTGTVVRGINYSGNFVGKTVGMPGGDVGFLVAGGAATPFTYLGMPANPISVNGFNEVVGNAGSPSVGFYRSPGGMMSAINFPGAKSTTPASINDSDFVGGNYIDNTATPKSHGFLYDRFTNQYFSFDIPGSTSTNVATITNSFQIWGNYVAGGVAHGYVLTPIF